MTRRKKRTGPAKPRNTSGLIPWKPGQSGNPAGRPKVITHSEAYGQARRDFSETDHTWAEWSTERMVKVALRRVSAVRELFRTGGNP
jgi:hypothetical protein